MVSVTAVCDFLAQLAPLDLAASWDNVGLLLGDRNAPVEKIMICLTVTPASAAEAIEAGVQLIVSHHPILFRPIQRLTADTPDGAMLHSLARAGVSVYSPHTAYDNCQGGINDQIAAMLGLSEVVPLRKGADAAQCKIVTFVPESDLEKVSEALFRAGAGRIGAYEQCSFRSSGTGTFFGSAATHPAVGQKERREEVDEHRLEVVCPKALLDAALAALRRAHSYEEPAIDIYPLKPKNSAEGEGRVGRLKTHQSFGDLARIVKKNLNCSQVSLVGEESRMVQTVAIVCGSGGDFWQDVCRAGADILLTGEAGFHDCLAAQASGVGLIVAGHYATERFAMDSLAERIQKEYPPLKVWASRRERDPLLTM